MSEINIALPSWHCLAGQRDKKQVNKQKHGIKTVTQDAVRQKGGRSYVFEFGHQVQSRLKDGVQGET